MSFGNGLIGEFAGGPGTGSLGGPPSGHNYKRAVYRPPPNDFSVDVLPPTKFGNAHCYGMRITPIHSDESDAHSTLSSPSHHEYEVWRRWEDCLWFQEILESEYSLMARQKRARLAAGKGVKKNGVYLQSDRAASFESLPPGPDAKSIAKEIHPLIPRLTKKGTLFRASQGTIDQRALEFQALIQALFQEDVPTLVKELREMRLVRDFFGYWRRDVDHDKKRQEEGKEKESTKSKSRQSIASSMFSMYFSASNPSLRLPMYPYYDSDMPLSPALSEFQVPRSLDSRSSSRRNSVQRDETRRRSTGRVPANYAISDSSGSTVSVASSPQSPTSAAHDMTFYVSNRGSLAFSLADDDEGARADHINAPLSTLARVQSSWTRDLDPPFPSQDEEVVIFVPEAGKTRQDPVSGSGEFYHGLQALPEDSELVPTVPTPIPSPHCEIEEVPRIPLRRPRNNSCPDRSNRQCLIFPQDAPRSAQIGGSFPVLDPGFDSAVTRAHPPHAHKSLSAADPRTPTTNTSSSRPSSMAYSSFSNFTCDAASRRTSWRTSMASDRSFATRFANGSCADSDRQTLHRHSFASFADGSCTDIDRGRGREARRSVASISSGGRKTAQAYRDSMTTLSSLLSDLSAESVLLPRRVTPPPSGSLRRSLSAGSRRPPSIMAALSGQEDWYEQQEDILDAYFYDPGMHPKPPPRAAEPPRTPPPLSEPLPHAQPFNKETASPDRFPRPFQNRPSGQFHLPWSASPPSTPGPRPPPNYPPPSPPPRSDTSSPLGSLCSATSASTSTPGKETITLKAVLQDSIVLLRVARAAPLSEVRTRLRDKFAAQEPGVSLAASFVLGWSSSGVGALSPQALRYVYTEEGWQEAVAACAGGKMTVRLFNAQPF